MANMRAGASSISSCLIRCSSKRRSGTTDIYDLMWGNTVVEGLTLHRRKQPRRKSQNHVQQLRMGEEMEG